MLTQGHQERDVADQGRHGRTHTESYQRDGESTANEGAHRRKQSKPGQARFVGVKLVL